MHRRLFLTLLVILGFSSLALATAAPLVAQSNGFTSTQQGADAAGHDVYKVGGDVSAPVLLHSVEPERPEGNANVSGSVQVTVRVDRNGNPSHVRVTRGLGMGLDEKAVMAVRQYKYKPAMKDGTPVMVELNVEVKF
jgi:TonB family protein